ncbi:MAG: cation diffusion facilitator family transporter [Chloroflexota bacterium]
MAHHHPHPEGPNAAGTALRLRVAIGLTALFVVLEGLAGLFSHSLALLSDAGHNLTDVLALVLSLWAFELASRPSTAERTFGLHRAGILAALANAIVLIVIAVGILVEAYRRFLAPEPVAADVMIAVAAVAMGLNLLIALWLHRASEHDLNVRSSFIHIAGDAASAAGVAVAGALLAFTGAAWIDPAVSVLIAAFIVWTSRGVIQEAIDVLLESTPSDLDARQVLATMRQVPGVLDVHDLHLWSISSALRAASAHVLVDDQPVSKACNILGAVNTVLADRYHIAHTSLQLETNACDPGEVFCHLHECEQVEHR